MSFEVRRRLSAADTVTLFNAVVGFAAGAIAFTDLELAVRLMLLAVIADAVDGIVARNGQSSAVGPLLDSITDVVSFGATPSLVVYALLTDTVGTVSEAAPHVSATVVVVAGSFAVFSIIRTAFYSTYIDDHEERPGIPNTLGTMILGTAYLAGVTDPFAVAGITLALSPMMLSPFDYPKPSAKHAGPMGLVLALAVVAPTALYRLGPRAMLAVALLFLTLGPRYYWDD